MKVPVIRKPEYTVYIEQLTDTFLHCDVRKWSPSICKALKADSDALFALHGGPWFAMNEPAGCEKHQRFMQIMGFKFFRVIDGMTFFRRI